MKVSIRKGTRKDFPILLSLIKGLAVFEKSPWAETNTLARMKKEHRLLDFLLAEVDGRIEGMAVYCITYSSLAGKTLHLDDIYVRPKYRGH